MHVAALTKLNDVGHSLLIAVAKLTTLSPDARFCVLLSDLSPLTPTSCVYIIYIYIYFYFIFIF